MAEQPIFTAFRFLGNTGDPAKDWKQVFVVGMDSDFNFLWIKNSPAQKEATRVLFSLIYGHPDEKGHRKVFDYKRAVLARAGVKNETPEPVVIPESADKTTINEE